MFAALLGFLSTFGSVEGDINQAAYSFHSSLVFAIRTLLAGQCVALVGLILLAIALIPLRARAAWLFTWGRIAMVPWLFLVPVGTVVGIIGFYYFADRRTEFVPSKQPDNPPSAA